MRARSVCVFTPCVLFACHSSADLVVCTAIGDAKTADKASAVFFSAFSELVANMKCTENKDTVKSESSELIGTLLALAVLQKTFAAKKAEWCVLFRCSVLFWCLLLVLRLCFVCDVCFLFCVSG